MIGPAEITDRGNVLALELRRIAVAHLDGIESREQADTVEYMALCIALADAILDARTRAGRPLKSPSDVVSWIVASPLEYAAAIAMHPDRPR